MIVSVAMISVRKGHEGQVADILTDYTTKEKKVPGCVRCYFKRAINNNDTFMVYTEYDTMDHFQASEKMVQEQQQEGGKVEFVLRPHILKAFYGNFD